MLIAVILLVLPLFASGDIEIRIVNHSKIPIADVRVWFDSETEEFGPIGPKGVTGYRVVRKAYCLARIEATVDGERAVIQPFDYVGEKELKAGRYTYVLTVNERASSEYDRLRLRCRKD